jgi:hypothetical protein
MMFVLSIKERNFSWAGRGPIAMTFATREQAEQEIIDYVSERWEDKLDVDRPDDPDDMVTAYFDRVLEEYEILEVNP